MLAVAILQVESDEVPGIQAFVAIGPYMASARAASDFIAPTD
jgi:hypothetical protein